MATNTFGRRGVVVATPTWIVSTRVTSTPVAAPIAPRPLSGEGTLFGDNKLLADIPFLTIGLIFALLLVFALQRSLAIDIAPDGSLDVRSVIASWRVQLRSGCWKGRVVADWPCAASACQRVAPHKQRHWAVHRRRQAGASDRPWLVFADLYCQCAGRRGRLAPGQWPRHAGVGASGAITGLIAALFVASFDPEADADQTMSRLKTSLFFGVPALLPLAFGASGNVNYYAHGGGALAGGALAIMPWLAFWSYDSLPRSASMTLLAGFVGSLICAGFAAAHYSSYMADARQYIRASEMPANTREMASRSSDFVTRYPKDPRAHLFRAIFFIEQNSLSPAETEVQTAMSLAASDVTGGPVRSVAQALRSDWSWCAVHAAVLPVCHAAALVNPIIGRELGLIEHVARWCPECSGQD